MPPVTPKRVKASPRRGPYDRDDKAGKNKKDMIKSPKVASAAWQPPANMNQLINEMSQPGYQGLTPIRLNNQDCPFLGPEPILTTTQAEKDIDEELTLAKNSAMLSPQEHSKYLSRAEVMVRTQHILYVAEHRLREQSIVTYVRPHDVQVGSMARELNDRCNKLVKNLQREIGNWFWDGVKSTRILYDTDRFDVAPESLRKKIWVAIFNRAPYRITIKMHATAAYIVDFDNIFHGPNTPERTRWRYAFRSLFVYGCEAMCKHRPGGIDDSGDPEMRLWYEGWRNITFTQEFKTMFPWWSVDVLPVNAGSLSRGRVTSPSENEIVGTMLALDDDAGEL